MMIAMVSTFAENRVQPVVNSQFQADNKVRIFYDDYDEWRMRVSKLATGLNYNL